MNLTAKIRGWRSSLKHNYKRRAVAASEFAMTLPIWVTLILGTSDGTYYMMANEKADRIAYSVTDIVSQYQTITQANLADIVQAAGQLMQPLPTSTTGTDGSTQTVFTVIISSVYKPAGQAPQMCWQYVNTGGVAPSRVGTANASNCGTLGAGAATLPNGLILNDNENVVIAEVYYNFVPLFIGRDLFGETTIYRNAVYKPRLSPLITRPI